MGNLIYDGNAINFDDRLLVHLQLVTIQKFRRSEGFLMSWSNGPETNYRRSSIWMQPSIPVLFNFVGSRVPDINRQLLEELTLSVNSSRGLVISPERMASVDVPRKATLGVAGPHL